MAPNRDVRFESVIALLLFFTVVGAACWSTCDARAAPPKKRCLVSCYYDREPVVCLYDEKPTCDRGECRETAHIVCRPRVKDLGPWNPVLNDVRPKPPYWRGR